MRVRTILVLAVVLCAAVALAGAPSAGAAVRSCSSKVDFNLEISSARNMTCAKAAGVMKAHKGSIGRRFHTGGFSCYRVSGSALAGQWRCVSGRRAFRFEFSD